MTRRDVLFLIASTHALGCAARQSRESVNQWRVSPAEKSFYPPIDRAWQENLAAALAKSAEAPTHQRKPLHVVSFTGGGSFASYQAGIVVGWTASGKRPDFDIVTGISSGALIASFAFLGPSYDERLTALFSNLKTRDLFTFRPIWFAITKGSLASASNLEKVIEAEITPQFMADLKAKHAKGQRLFIATVDLNTKRPVIWDITSIAASCRVDAPVLVRKILLAAAAYPGFLPPVPFNVEVEGKMYQEEHADGGAALQAFVCFGPGFDWPSGGEIRPNGWLNGSNIYVVVGGKVYADPVPTTHSVLRRADAAISTLNYALCRSDLHKMYTLASISGMKFQMIALRPDFNAPLQQMWNTDPVEMNRIFQEGFDQAAKGNQWRFTPPGAEPGEEVVPRGTVNSIPIAERSFLLKE